MPTVQTLSLSVSSPKSSSGKAKVQLLGGAGLGATTLDPLALDLCLVPIELTNNCSEASVTIESDDVRLTNAIRCHFLQHFGHRDLDAIVADYAPDAILIQVVNGGAARTGGGGGAVERTKYHGHDEIRQYYADLFTTHPTGESSFTLEHVTVEQRHGVVVWSAKTPTTVITQGSDTLVFNAAGKIIKQFLTCQTRSRENPGTARVVRKTDDKECGGFFY